jgi:methionyl-tRNA formyltransferase
VFHTACLHRDPSAGSFSALMRIVFFGTGDIALPSFRWLLDHYEVVALVTQPDKPAGRKLELTPPRIKVAALERGVEVFQPVKMRAPEAVAKVQSFAADAIVVMAYGQILPKAVLDAASVACLNLHASILPRWRGAAPIQAAIEAGDEFTGITVMYMDEGLDTGDMLLVRRVRIGENETGGELHDRLGLEASGAMALSLAMLEHGDAPREPQPAEGITYAGKLTREHGELDFSAGRAAVQRRIRAMNPWPAAATKLGPLRLKVFSAFVSDEAGEAGIVMPSSDGLWVGTGDGSVIITDLQLEGKKRMEAKEFLRGHPIPAGTKLGAK